MPKGFAGVYMLIILVIAALGGVYYFGKLGNTSVSQPQVSISPTSQDQKTDEVDNWKTYTNTKYGFQITYPAKGMIDDNGCFGVGGRCGQHLGECGSAIKEVKDEAYYMAIDNFFRIFPETWTGTIKDYIEQKDPKGIEQYSIISSPTADEAVKMDGIDKDKLKLIEGYSPLAYYMYIFRKGNLLISLRGFQNPGNIGGCIINPNDKDWVRNSLKFN